MVNGIIKKHT